MIRQLLWAFLTRARDMTGEEDLGWADDGPPVVHFGSLALLYRTDEDIRGIPTRSARLISEV